MNQPRDSFTRLRFRASLTTAACVLAAVASSTIVSNQAIQTPASPNWLLWLQLSLTAALPVAAGAITYIYIGRETERLRNDLQRMQRFSQDATHELASPISIVRSRLQIMQRARVQANPDAAPLASDADLEIINDAVERMGKLIDDLRILARSQSDFATLNLSIIKLDKLVQSTINEMEAPSAEKQISIDCERLDPVTVIGDREGLQRVISNLIGNAVRYGNLGGRISVSLANEKRIKIVVGDNGPGIPEEQLEFIFDRFYRTAEARSNQKAGSGLGLAIVKNIAESHGGGVSVKSKLGEGTEFTIFLPKMPRVHPALELFSKH